VESINTAWLDDHFAVCLDRTTKGLINPWTKQPLPEGELEGWNAYSLYTSNGLLYLLATATPLPAGLDLERFRLDLVNSRRESLIEYGCTHSSADLSNIWVSQNLHRDFSGAYLGVDPGGMLERYWAFEQFENSVGRGGCFVDTYGANHLHYYPRGITSLGIFPALAGMRLDKVAGVQEFKPVRAPLRLPLLNLCDWAKEKPVFLEVDMPGATTRISE
jgi:xylan 1,4-beta-xylosidase